ncbi:unnamed protein product [Cuscuta campestris]|uniref:DUF8039 domain-containing protein n=1 Tax=Cuscuta campestris TaxID=132261 RepID=A0A484M8M6_9ASTE|nr:unnamed protein product [Cuscuta campestris]
MRLPRCSDPPKEACFQKGLNQKGFNQFLNSLNTSTQQNAQAGRAIQKPILRSSPRHKKPEGLLERNEMQCHSAPKLELRKSPRLKRKDRPSTLTVVQALSGSRSKNVQSHSTPLPVTPKPKPISDIVQKQIKQKRKREELGFDLPPSAQKLVLQLVNSKWKQFKSTLTCKYILPFRDELERLRTPPEDFSFLEKNHWDIFVADRLSPEFLKVHDEHVKRVKENKYPHRLSRKGYANLEQEWAKTHSGDESVIDRSVTWVLARKDKEGNFKSDSTKQKAEEIEFLREQVCSGVLTEEGDDDVLTKALGKPEHGGRVRGQGMHVRKAVYFNLPRSKKQKTQTTVDEQVKEGVRQLLAEETFFEGSSPAVPSQEASCSPKFREGGQNQQVARKNLKDSFDAELEPLRENNDIGDECNHILSVAEHVDKKQHEKEREKNEREDQEIDTVEKLVEVGGLKVEKKAEKDVFVDVDSGESQMAQLAVGFVDNIVAHAKVYGFSRMDDLTLHGEKLGEEYAKVSITEAIKDVDIPVPIPGEVLTVEQAKGTFVAWPKELIVLDVLPKGKSNLKTVKKKKAPKRLKKAHVQDDEECGQEFQVEFGAECPLQLKRLWLWAKEALSDDRAHTFVLNKDAFGVEKKLSVFLSDIHALCARGEMVGSIITIYIHCLYELVKKNKMLQMISFVDPGMVGTLACGNIGQRSRKLADRFKGACDGQHFLIPFNDVLSFLSLTIVMSNTSNNLSNEELLASNAALKAQVEYLAKQVAQLTKLKISMVNTPEESDEDEEVHPETNSSNTAREENHERGATDFKVDIPTFEGKNDPDDFLEWLEIVECVFDFKDVPEEKKVKIVALKFRKYASTWWSNLSTKRRRENKAPVKTWLKMRS